MNCNEFVDKISLYIDDEMTEIDKKEFELHFLKCDRCRQEYENMINILKSVRDQEQVELPDNYRFELRRKLKEVAKEEKKINWRVISSIAAGLIIMIISISMFSDNLPFSLKDKSVTQSIDNESKEDKASMDIDKTMGIMEAESPETETFENSSTEDSNIAVNSAPLKENELQGDKPLNDFGIMASRSNLGNVRKSVKEAYLSINIDESNSVSELITNYVEEKGGFIESINIESSEDETGTIQKSYLIKIRIPCDKFDETLDFLRQIGRLVDEQSVQNDVTENYYRIEANLTSLYDQENLLMEILNKAEDKKDKLLVEDELKKVKEEINSESSALEEIDNSIILSTIDTKINVVNKEGN